MMILVQSPTGCSPERRYPLDVLFGEWLGAPYRLTQTERDDVSIRLADHPGEIRLADGFFGQFLRQSGTWLSEDSFPVRPLQTWDSSGLATDIPLVDPVVPILYGEGRNDWDGAGETIHLPIDVFGSAFFMLTRYEEVVNPARDQHDRFPAEASLAYQERFLERPLIDEYVEILWAAMRKLWPGLTRKARHAQTLVSHDVDDPSRYGFRNPMGVLRACANDLLEGRAPRSVVWAPAVWWASRERLHPRDPCNTFDWLMDQSEHRGLRSAFYFICGRTDPGKDANYEIEQKPMRALLRRIHERGHEIGLHPSYGTYQSPDAIVAEAERLQRVCAEEGIAQDTWGGRMHYLRWETPTTLHGWEQAGMTYDSTLSYADHAGFRCGTCHEYPAFDPVARRPLALRIRPLIAMDCTVMAGRYMGLGTSEAAYDVFARLRRACERVNGNFTLLWHNTQVVTSQERELYQAVIK